MKKYVLVSGSRTFYSREVVELNIESFLRPGDVLMHGGASGVDIWASIAAEKVGADVWERRAAWDKYGKSAGIRRNRAMLDEITSYPNHMVLVFWNGYSKGTEHMLSLCNATDVPYLLWEGPFGGGK